MAGDFATRIKQIVTDLRVIGSDTQKVEVKLGEDGFPKSVLETLSAFSNGSGGTVILGLDESQGFSPAKKFDAKKIRDALAEACDNQMEPPVRATVEIVPFEDANVVVADVLGLPANDKPCYIKSRRMYEGSFVRTGDGDRKLSSYEIDRLMENKGQPKWDIEVVTEAGIKDLDENLWKAVLQTERSRSERFQKMSDEDVLQKLRVIAPGDDGKLHPTLAGLLCLGDYPQEFFPQLTLTYVLFPGTRRSSQPGEPRYLDSKRFSGPISQQVYDGVMEVSKAMRRGGIVKGALRHELPDYSLVAVREALTNALLHRDYSPSARGTQVQLNIYADRLEVVNPGGLYGAVTLDMLGKTVNSSSRNSFMARLLEVTPYPEGGFVAENRGTGYQEILDSLEREFLPPPIPEDKLTQFVLTFERRRMTEAEKAAAGGESSRERVLAHLEKVYTATSKDLAAAAGIGVGGVRRILNDLVKEGLVERTEPTRSPKQRYRAVKNK